MGLWQISAWWNHKALQWVYTISCWGILPMVLSFQHSHLSAHPSALPALLHPLLTPLLCLHCCTPCPQLQVLRKEWMCVDVCSNVLRNRGLLEGVGVKLQGTMSNTGGETQLWVENCYYSWSCFQITVWRRQRKARRVRTLRWEWMERALKDLDTLFSFILWTQSCTGLLQTEQMLLRHPSPAPGLRRTILLQRCWCPQHFLVLSTFALFSTRHQTHPRTG